MVRPTHPGSPTHAHDLASLLDNAHLLRAHAAHVGKLPDERFRQAYVRVSSALSAHLDGTSPQPSAALASLESELLGLYNQLAVAIAPVSAESIRSTETARNAAVFFPTVFAVAFSAAVFLLVVLLQGYGVIGKGLRDSIQQQDAKRKELVFKLAAIDDLLMPIRGSLTTLVACASNAAEPRKPSAAESAERAAQCARYSTLKEEETKHELSRRPVARELTELQAQVRPASTVLRNWFQSAEELFGWKPWDSQLEDELKQLEVNTGKARDRLAQIDATEKAQASGSPSARTAAPARDSSSPSFERIVLRSIASNEVRRTEQAQQTRGAEIEEIRWRVLLHRFDILLQVVQGYVLPALLGLLGALVFILRELAVRLRTWTYIPESWSNGTGRVVVGTMAGVLGGWFIPASEGASRSLPPLVIPFLLGYSVNILFSWLDKAVGVMSSPEPQPRA